MEVVSNTQTRITRRTSALGEYRRRLPARQATQSDRLDLAKPPVLPRARQHGRLRTDCSRDYSRDCSATAVRDTASDGCERQPRLRACSYGRLPSRALSSARLSTPMVGTRGVVGLLRNYSRPGSVCGTESSPRFSW